MTKSTSNGRDLENKIVSMRVTDSNDDLINRDSSNMHSEYEGTDPTPNFRLLSQDKKMGHRSA